MTAYQRPERVDRDALIEAAGFAVARDRSAPYGPQTEDYEAVSCLLQLNGVLYADVPKAVTDALTTAVGQLAAVRDLIAHARLVSPSERAVIRVSDLERALGIDAPVPHKLGGNADV